MRMEKAYKEGKVRAIGLSNFSEEQIREASPSAWSGPSSSRPSSTRTSRRPG
ncbi:Transporter [Giardia duodenalis]|uniref:Transporter n=1 Tax=Giardia intestinalis TaxID=5741 RepID=V6U1J5_GIAIN|nr:Transporter [Giardia intestinalis]